VIARALRELAASPRDGRLFWGPALVLLAHYATPEWDIANVKTNTAIRLNVTDSSVFLSGPQTVDLYPDAHARFVIIDLVWEGFILLIYGRSFTNEVIGSVQHEDLDPGCSALVAVGARDPTVLFIDHFDRTKACRRVCAMPGADGTRCLAYRFDAARPAEAPPLQGISQRILGRRNDSPPRALLRHVEAVGALQPWSKASVAPQSARMSCAAPAGVAGTVLVTPRESRERSGIRAPPWPCVVLVVRRVGAGPECTTATEGPLLPLPLTPEVPPGWPVEGAPARPRAGIGWPPAVASLPSVPCPPWPASPATSSLESKVSPGLMKTKAATLAPPPVPGVPARPGHPPAPPPFPALPPQTPPT